VISKIMENEKAVQAMGQEADAKPAIAPHHAPELGKKSNSSS
jgi:hypothetical protein